MRCPTLNELPPPPPGKTGWPWTEAGQQLPDLMPYGAPWPRISVITPSYNQGAYLEETIRSVLLQGYPNLEYLIMDGGSTDESTTIIQKYAQWISYWVSERDCGQANALNKGFARCTGDLLGWINSDDLLLPEALHRMANAHHKHSSAVLLGDAIIFVDQGTFVQHYRQRRVTFEGMVRSWDPQMRWNQPGTYVPRSLYERVGGLDESLRYVFDRDWMCRLLQVAPVIYLHEPIARFRMHTASKSSGEANAWLPEHILVTERYWDKVPGLDKRQARARMEIWYGALPYLSVVRYQMNRPKGVAHLWRALRYDWRVLFWVYFLILCITAITPQALLRKVRRFVDL